MTPQTTKLVKIIRERKVNYDSAEQTANVILKEYREMGFPVDDLMIANIGEAARIVRESEQDVEILRKNSIIAEREEWYGGPSEGDRHWPALHSYLENTKGWDPGTIASLDQASNEVVSLLDNPGKTQFSCRGLVVGYVQSGKTANMTAVMAKGVDAGYNLVIVLGGVTNKLRKQTQDRFEKDVLARYRHLWQVYTTGEMDGDFSHPANGSFQMPHEGHAQLIVMKKEGSRLRALKKTIKKTPPIILEKLKVLLIDDECDQASVNSARGDYDITSINKAIREVLAALPAVAYVGYTATPFANVFIDPFPFNQEKLDDLYPRDFITSLEKPAGYFGTADVFGGDSADGYEGRDMVRLLASDDPGRLRPTKPAVKGTFQPEMTDSLRDAIMWFLATCAIRRARGQASQHMTMLIHSSQYIAQHDFMSDLVKEWVGAHGPDVVAGTGNMGSRFDELFAYEATRTAPAGQDRIPETIDAVREHLPAVLEALQFPVENGESDRRMAYEDGPKTYIVVGGTVLARGLTLEGLTVSFFLRTSKQYDTLLQMGRWFGYRPGYDDLPRLWTTTDLVSNFRALAEIEEEIRTDIATYRERNLTPLQFAVKVRSIPGMAITAATKMKHAHKTSVSFDGQHVQTIRFDHRNIDILRGNWKAASELVDRALNVAKRDDQERRVLFTGVPHVAIRRFVAATSISDEHMSLKKPHLLGYLDLMPADTTAWNVGVVLPKSDTESTKPLGGLGKVGTLKRARIGTAPPHYADIKALMSKRDILIDAGSSASDDSHSPQDWNYFKSLRPNVPLLLLYPVDAKSSPKPGSKTRVALDAVEDVIGFGMVFPGERDRSGGYFSVELDAPATEQFEEDELAELDEGEDPHA